MIEVEREESMDNLDRLISEVRRIAAERPDVTSDTKECMYEAGICSDGSVGCLFGQGFVAMGWKPYRPGVSEGLSMVLDEEYGDDHRLEWCCDVQDRQDDGTPWAKAIQLSDEDFGL